MAQRVKSLTLSRVFATALVLLAIQRNSSRFLIGRVVVVALDELRQEDPGLEATITNVKDLDGIYKYTFVLMTGGLVVNEKLVCVGRYPRKEEVIGWLRAALRAADAQQVD
jgi:hypothetical protein